MDDASTDETLSVLREFEQQYPDWIKVIALAENKGAASARDPGWAEASQPSDSPTYGSTRIKFEYDS